MELQVNEREALLIVTALGVYQNRIGQNSSWLQRKRLPTLRSRLADAITINDEAEANTLRHILCKTARRIEVRINLGREISNLRERIKLITDITDEKVIQEKSDDDGVGE